MSRLIALLSLLSFLVPLVALLLTSLGLVLLKRKSGLPAWLARLAAPPFYLVSLPIATLVVGAEMLGWYFLLLLLSLSLGPFLEVLSVFPFVIPPWFAFPSLFDSGVYLLGVFGSLIGFWTATFISGYLLCRTIWRENHHPASSRVASGLLRALLLLICFAWAFFYLASYVHQFMVHRFL
ncbi:MAG TPA: hypothetical protein VGH62_17080 [Bradyrhizobium sp.]